ncbi:SusD/RagB family nutrient-binding outer membrane lipoprotein [Maribellus comscasis]|uniref:SusD/RagB family nutrient-binding outer membrane lipoprotein n=1 Tax=Maribellus comscasis TaxID=2681766 RepID=A0A6I6K6L3_9BACT|nr:SusD/RagB family nutrient-binding outer membrane lipoprotein [Maribellus comscasis]QGY47303.1 SusD/RagB family nutrient-binding outer membrane lipoprotein [Maribellus comscasis]
MKLIKAIYKLVFALLIVFFVSCSEQLTDLNVNPNGVDPAVVNPNLMVPTIITSTAKYYLDEGYKGGSAGVMQYIQQSGWSGETNKFDWDGARDWTTQYGNLRTAKHLYERSNEEGMEFQQGVAIVIRAFNFAYISDSWGDAPYSNALNGNEGDQEDLFPIFDSQETIYKGIIDELKEANTLLSKSSGEYSGINADADVLYSGDPSKWRKFANSLMLRYYMRVSEKLPDFAKAGIEEIVSNPGQYPIFTSIDDDATMEFVGSSNDDSWPANTTFDLSESSFDRIQLCAGFRDVLVKNDDPRIAVWFNEVAVPIKVSTAVDEDEVIDGVRYLNPDFMVASDYVVYNPSTWVEDVEAGKTLIDTMQYAGLPIASTTGDGSGWNLNPNKIQGGPNVHNSALDDKYKAEKGDLLKARFISYTEVCFILAEAAQKGWSVGSQQEWYEKGIKASFDTWEVSDDYDTYITEPDVVYDGSLEQLITQKWIANWTVAHESWCDWRRTGYPELTIGKKGVREAMPLRFQYGSAEISRNGDNYETAVSGLEETSFTATDGKDSAWSKIWLIQGTGKPY